MNKLKSIFIFLSLFLLTGVLYTQPTWQWAKSIHSNVNEIVLDIETDPSNGETYACGYFDGDLSAIFTQGLNGTPDMSSPLGNRDGFVAKYDAVGNIIWAFKIGGGSATVEIEAITLAPNGNIYITGEFFNGMIDFKGVTSSLSSSKVPTGATKDMFLAAYTPNGELIWVTSSTDTGNSIGFGITADANGIYVAGRFGGDITFPPLAPITWSGSTPFFDAYIAKFDYSGNAIQVKTIFSTTGDGHLKAWNVKTDGNNVFVVGTSGSTSWTYGPTGFNPTDNNNGAAGTEDIWVISIRENNFNLNWSSIIGGVENDIAKGIALDIFGIYLTGGLGGASINFPGTPPVASIGTAQDIFTCKLVTPSGLTDWVQMEQNNTASDAYGTDITIDPSGNLYITGSCLGNTNFNGGTNTKTSSGGKDVFVMARKVNGNFLWVETAGSAADDEGFGVSFDNNGNIYSGGSYDKVSTFGALNLPNDGQNNGFVAQLNPCIFSITCPADQTVTANASCQYTLLDYSALVATTATCGVASIVQTPVSGTVVTPGINPITFLLTDNNGNKDSCTFNVIVEAAVNPTVVSCGSSFIGETTVGQGDTENNFACVGYTTPGEDVYYQITVPTGNYYLQMSINNVVDANDSWLETFWVGGSCPLGGGCLSSDFYDISTQQFSGGGNTIQFLAVGPGTYYFVVDAQNDGIDSYDISFDCLEGGIEFDESTTCGDPDSNGVIAYVNGSTALVTQTCATDTFCHDLFIANQQDFEWIDSVYMDLGTCYTNVVPTAVAGFYETGTWLGIYNAPTNSISWQFNNTNVSTWGDGSGGSYSCDLGKTRLHTFCFTADISASCAADSNLNISLLISDDAIGSGGAATASIDKVISTGFTITNSAPTINCLGNKVVNSAPGVCDTIVNGLTPTINDNCPGAYVTYTLTGATTGSGLNDASGLTYNLGITTIKYMVTDSLGLQDSCSFTVTVNDVEPPSITCLSNQVEYGCSFSLPSYPPLSFSDNCTPNSSIAITQKPIAGSIITKDSLITIYATDASGNIDSCSFMVILSDTIKPTITCPGNVSVANNGGTCGAIVNAIAPIANDNCGIDSVNYVLSGATTGSGLNDVSGLTFNLGTTTVVYTVTDLSNNTKTCSFTIVVVDNEPPTITCVSNIFVNNDVGTCNAIVNGLAPIVNDNCAIDSVSYVLSGLTTGNGLTDASGLTYNLGVTTVTYTVLDSSGNISTCSFTVTVTDTEAPTFTCQSSKNEFVNNSCSFNIPDYTGTITGLSDNCTPDAGITLTQFPLQGTTIVGHGTTQLVTIYAEDANSNIDSCSFTITLKDTIKPTIVCPGNQTEIVGSNCNFIIPTYSPANVFDNCASAFGLTLTQQPVIGAIVNTDTLVTLFANDGNGNVASCSFMLFLSDTTSPTIICPTDTVINNDIGLCGATISLGLPVAADNCMVSSLINDFNNTGNAAGLYPLGGTIVSWVATDGFANTATCSFNVTIIDAETPSIACINDTIINNDVNSCDAVFNYSIIATDNCNYTISQIAGLASGSVFPSGTTLNTFVAIDAAGLSDTCSFIVTVIDNTNPTIICPNDVVICDSNVIVDLPTINDNCMIVSATNDYSLTGNASSIYPIGVTIINWTVADTSGNFASCSMSVEVEEKPSIPSAGVDQNLVLNQNTNLTANTPIIGVGVWSLVSGSGDIDNDFDPSSYLSGLMMGNNIFAWTITNGTCPSIYDEVTIIVGGLKVPSGFSPNGDGNNDLFVIPGIETVASELIVFNRWGVEIYTVNNYQNDWGGISTDGKTLPNDTYFYTIKLPKYTEEYSGYIVIKR